MTLQLDGLGIEALHALYIEEKAKYYGPGLLDTKNDPKAQAPHGLNVLQILERVSGRYWGGSDQVLATKALINIRAQADIYKSPTNPWNALVTGAQFKNSARVVSLMRGLPEGEQLHVYLGKYYFEQKNYGQAVTHFRRDLGQDPEGLYYMGRAYNEMGPEYAENALYAYVSFVERTAFKPDDRHLLELAKDATERFAELIEANEGVAGLRRRFVRAIMGKRGNVRNIMDVPVSCDNELFSKPKPAAG
jgi:tetratricopeptide (TPR) repeat protein